MNRYTPTILSAMFVLMAFLPCQVLAASITETSAAIGKDCVAIGYYSTAMGLETRADGNTSTAMGYKTHAVGDTSTAMGGFTRAAGYYCTAMGYNTQAGGWVSTAMGKDTIAWGNFSFAGGVNMQLTGTAHNTFVWGHSITVQELSEPNVFLIFPAGTPGKVGIGTGSPNEVLEVAGNGRAFFGDGGGSSRKGLLIDGTQASTGARLEAFDYGAFAGLDLVINTIGQGNVGIGTTSPSYKLEVDGDAGKPDGGSWSNSSDVRLKDISGEYDRGLDQIVNLKPVIFYYKEGNPRGLPSDEEYIGFIAQEVSDLFPEAVSKGEDGYLDFNMHPVNVAVVNAIKELKAENDEIRSENEYLRVENAILKKDIEKIKLILGI